MKNSRKYNLTRDWAMLTALVVLVASIGYFTIVFAGDSTYVPKEFFEARAKGADISDNIVKLTGESVSTLKEISRLEAAKDYDAGVTLVLEEINRNEASRQAALDLSTELEAMAGVLSNIKPDEASEIALQAIIYESQIVQRLINHHNYLYQLLELLRSRFLNGESASNEMVLDLINRMNTEVTAINDLNQRYKEAMAEFDLLTNE